MRYTFLLGLKAVGKIVYPTKLNWIGKKPDSWNDISLLLILNHTSLFEFVYSVGLPPDFLKSLSERLVIPVAEKTMKKPISGFIFKNLTPHTISLTRKRDESWQTFLDNIKEDNICIFMPEGQMKRKNGLDKNGNPMKVKTGVYDLLMKYRGKKMALVYSHGLHHVLAPGDKIPKIFKSISADIEMKDINQYLSMFEKTENPAKDIAKDLEQRRDQHCS